MQLSQSICMSETPGDRRNDDKTKAQKAKRAKARPALKITQEQTKDPTPPPTRRPPTSQSRRLYVLPSTVHMYVVCSPYYGTDTLTDGRFCPNQSTSNKNLYDQTKCHICNSHLQ